MRRPAVALSLVATLLAGTFAVVERGTARAGTLPGQNGRIVYGSVDEANRNRIFAMNPNGSNRVQVSQDVPGFSTSDRQPEFSPTADQIAFSRAIAPTSGGAIDVDIYVSSADGSGAMSLTSDIAGDSSDPTWSPDGTKIAFVVDEVTDDSIFVMNADGTNKTRVISPGNAPAWSPDGTRIAFVSTTGIANTDIYVSGVDGTGRTRLSATPSNDGPPNWAPDGSSLIYTSNAELWTVNADGSGEEPLTDSPQFVEANPVWSPDGTTIALRKTNGPSRGIYVMNADGTNLTAIAVHPLGGDNHPSWERLTTSPEAPTVSIGSASSPEGDADGPRDAYFTVTLSEPAVTQVRVHYTVRMAAGVDNAAGPDDFRQAAGAVTFNPALATGMTSTSRVITARLRPDLIDEEQDEAFEVVLNSVQGIGVSGRAFVLGGSGPQVPGSAVGQGLILDDDATPDLEVWVGDASSWEGYTSNKPTIGNIVRVAVALSEAATVPITIRLTAVDGTAHAGADYEFKEKTVTFKPGQTRKTAQVRIRPDLLQEADEYLLIQASDPTATNVVGRPEGVVRILNDD